MAKGDIRKVLAVALVGSLIVVGCSESESDKQEKAEKAAAVQSAKVEDKRKGFHCLSSWDGSHRATVTYVKENLRDPDSYQHIKTSITPVDKDGNHLLIMQYRAKNGFGGYANGSVMVIVKNEDCSGKLVGPM
jgi:hypothetical protein